MTEKDRKYINRKIEDIKGYIAVASGAASMISLMEGHCTDGVIKARDQMTDEVVKTIWQIIKRVDKNNQ